MVQQSPILREWIVPQATIMRNINRTGYQKYFCCDKLLCCIIIVFFLYMRQIDIISLITKSMWLCEGFCVRQCNRSPNQICGAPKKPCLVQPCSVWKGDGLLLKIQVMLLLQNYFKPSSTSCSWYISSVLQVGWKLRVLFNFLDTFFTCLGRNPKQ